MNDTDFKAGIRRFAYDGISAAPFRGSWHAKAPTRETNKRALRRRTSQGTLKRIRREQGLAPAHIARIITSRRSNPFRCARATRSWQPTR